ncbi:TIGR02679 domain-containing protein [Dactylosporangium sp. CA-233914]|uniref:TIGR02679 domain-containing protein n=1 Tax=Dactylosporangium sp. CA-233914 TaxID=3239934 RepID=UPI003D8AC8A9
MIAAHVVERRLGERVRENARRRDALTRLHEHAIEAFARIPHDAAVRPDLDMVWPVLHRNGWIARLAGTTDGAAVIDQAAAVIAALPTAGERLDRRRLAEAVTRYPHALDTGPLPGLVLAILAAAGVIPTGQSPRTAWAAVGVDCDDLTGGLLALGIHPAGWSLPPGTVVTLPPRELARCAWPAPPGRDTWVFVTENPSVVTAAADQVAAADPPFGCCAPGNAVSARNRCHQPAHRHRLADRRPC